MCHFRSGRLFILLYESGFFPTQVALILDRSFIFSSLVARRVVYLIRSSIEELRVLVFSGFPEISHANPVFITLSRSYSYLSSSHYGKCSPGIPQNTLCSPGFPPVTVVLLCAPKICWQACCSFSAIQIFPQSLISKLQKDSSKNKARPKFDPRPGTLGPNQMIFTRVHLSYCAGSVFKFQLHSTKTLEAVAFPRTFFLPLP